MLPSVNHNSAVHITAPAPITGFRQIPIKSLLSYLLRV